MINNKYCPLFAKEKYLQNFPALLFLKNYMQNYAYPDFHTYKSMHKFGKNNEYSNFGA